MIITFLLILTFIISTSTNLLSNNNDPKIKLHYGTCQQLTTLAPTLLTRLKSMPAQKRQHIFLQALKISSAAQVSCISRLFLAPDFDQTTATSNDDLIIPLDAPLLDGLLKYPHADLNQPLKAHLVDAAHATILRKMLPVTQEDCPTIEELVTIYDTQWGINNLGRYLDYLSCAQLRELKTACENYQPDTAVEKMAHANLLAYITCAADPMGLRFYGYAAKGLWNAGLFLARLGLSDNKNAIAAQ